MRTDARTIRRTLRFAAARLRAKGFGWRQVVTAAGLAVALPVLSACSTWTPDRELVQLTQAGRYAEARGNLLADAPTSVRHPEYALTALRLGMLDLAEGQAAAAEQPFIATYDVLRRQGVNPDETLGIFFQDEERLIYWKGEPFEQAMAYAYFAVQLAMVRDWFNARAAASQSLFLLKSFERATGTENPTPEQIAEAAADAEADAEDDGRRARDDDGFDDYLQRGYVPERTNFVPGYMMQGLAVFAGGSTPEDLMLAQDSFARAIEYAPQLEPLVDDILAGRVNTIFWVDAGLGPAKVRYGPSGSLSRFTPVDRSTESPIVLTRPGFGGSRSSPVAADLNEYAADHRWRGLESARQAKQALGEARATGGVALAAISDDGTTQLVGLGLALVGALQSGGAAADVRYVEIMPQRVYFVGARIEGADETVTLRVRGRPGSTVTLAALDPPERDQRVQVRYVRLPSGSAPKAWASSGMVLYGNERFEGDVPGDGLPYIMGGTCVRPPTAEALARYRAAGNLRDLTLTELENLYRSEGVTWTLGDQRGLARTHVVEGGDSLIAPLAGTTGYARLFGQTHPRYRPRSEALKRFLAERFDARASTRSFD